MPQVLHIKSDLRMSALHIWKKKKYIYIYIISEVHPGQNQNQYFVADKFRTNLLDSGFPKLRQTN
jgi:hypothetical protein